MPGKYFGTDGIRGEFGLEPFTNNFFIILGISIAKFLIVKKSIKKKVLIGSDTRESSSQIINLISHGLKILDFNIDSAGIVPTPAIAFYTKKEKYDIGLMVSASHNLFKDNGVKIFNENGYKISSEEELHIETYISSLLESKNHYERKDSNICDVSKKVIKEYKNFCTSTVANYKSHNKKITLDLANGSNYKIAGDVYKRVGYDVSIHNNKPNGRNINYKCGSTYLKNLPAQIKKDNSKYGLSFDGDGDRLVVMNHQGKILDGDDILYTIIKGKIIENENVSGVVGTIMTNYSLEEFLRNEKIPFQRVKVGDKYVLEKMIEKEYSIGGETSGHILMKEYLTCGDSLIAGLQFLHYSDILKKNNIDIFLNKYPQKITNIFYEKSSDESIINIIIEESKNFFTKTDARIIIRKSGTENCIRIMVESKDEGYVKSLSIEIRKFIEDKINLIL